jgi:hypothetical protein
MPPLVKLTKILNDDIKEFIDIMENIWDQSNREGKKLNLY